MTRWRSLPEDPRYRVSDDGQVFSVILDRLITIYAVNQHATCRIGRRNRYVHALVAATFIGPRPTGMVIRHLDGDASNNRVSNLRYGSVSENNFDQVRHGTHAQARKTECLRGHAFTVENTYDCPSRPNVRYCKQCRAEHQALRTERRSAARKARRAALLQELLSDAA